MPRLLATYTPSAFTPLRRKCSRSGVTAQRRSISCEVSARTASFGFESSALSLLRFLNRDRRRRYLLSFFFLRGILFERMQNHDLLPNLS